MMPNRLEYLFLTPEIYHLIEAEREDAANEMVGNIFIALGVGVLVGFIMGFATAAGWCPQ